MPTTYLSLKKEPTLTDLPKGRIEGEFHYAVEVPGSRGIWDTYRKSDDGITGYRDFGNVQKWLDWLDEQARHFHAAGRLSALEEVELAVRQLRAAQFGHETRYPNTPQELRLTQLHTGEYLAALEALQASKGVLG
jgi:hypothetical protein